VKSKGLLVLHVDAQLICKSSHVWRPTHITTTVDYDMMGPHTHTLRPYLSLHGATAFSTKCVGRHSQNLTHRYTHRMHANVIAFEMQAACWGQGDRFSRGCNELSSLLEITENLIICTQRLKSIWNGMMIATLTMTEAFFLLQIGIFYSWLRAPWDILQIM